MIWFVLKKKIKKGTAELILADSTTDNSESDLVAKRIMQLLSDEKDDSITYKNIAILCRKRNSFVELEESFVRFGIPFTIIGGKGFYQRQTIYDVYNYLSFLLNTENDAALIGILRSPFFNISDLQLYQISLDEGNSFFEKLEIKSVSDSEIKFAVEKLKENIKIAFGMEISSLIRKLLLESGYWAVIAAKQNSPQELANIEKLLTLARGYSKKVLRIYTTSQFFCAKRLMVTKTKDKHKLHEMKTRLNSLQFIKQRDSNIEQYFSTAVTIQLKMIP